jgi:hypothetical protein
MEPEVKEAIKLLLCQVLADDTPDESESLVQYLIAALDGYDIAALRTVIASLQGSGLGQAIGEVAARLIDVRYPWRHVDES